MKHLQLSYPGILSIKNLFLALAATLPFSPNAFAAGVILAWDPSPDAGIAYYRLHYGTASGVYTSSTNAGLATTATVDGLVAGTTYYFGATAVGTNQLESDFSNEIVHTVPLPSNTPPTITVISNQDINEDETAGPISITVGDQETAAGGLTLSATSSDTALLPVANIVFGGSGANRNVTLTPVANASGSSLVTVTVSDGELTAGRQFTLTVNPLNDAPTVTSINNQTIDEDSIAGPIGFTVGDVESSPGALTLSGTSSNPTLVPNGNIVFGGNGANRNVTITPAASQFGTAQITVIVSDGDRTASRQFTLTVNEQNDSPTITVISDQSIDEDAAAGPISFTVGDQETAPGSLTLSASSSDTDLLPVANIIFGGNGANRTVTLTPEPDASGSAQVTISVSDGTVTTDRQFTLTVAAVNDRPTITSISNQTIDEDSTAGPISFTVGDVESSAGTLTLTGSSSNPALVPNGNVVFGGSGSSRSVTVTPLADQFGSAQITVTVSDGDLGSNETFTLTVNSVEDPPAAPTNLRLAQGGIE